MKVHFPILVLVIFAPHFGVAQSGRNKNPPPSASPSPEVQTPNPTPSPSPVPKPTQAEPLPTPAAQKFHPSALIITGRLITEGGKSYWSNDPGYVADEIKFLWDLERLPAKIVKGGKTTRTKAVARAKSETDSYVLYMEIHETIGSTGMRMISTVDHIDYVLLMPGTGEVARQFVVNPRTIVQTNEHGTVLPPRTQGHSSDYYDQLRRCAWEMARILRYWL
jgi:hypothetical protein